MILAWGRSIRERFLNVAFLALSPLSGGDKQVGRFGWPDLPLNSFLSRAVRGEPGGRPW
jgi:hypothetical protein